MFADERHARILERVNSSGRASVTELAGDFDVTQETIRRDLDALELRGLLRRVHGGAVGMDDFSRVEPSVTDRQQQRNQQKHRIARAALSFVPRAADGSLVLDAGTTTEHLAQLLAQDPGKNPDIITNSVPAAMLLSTRPNVSLDLLGGQVRALTAASVGERACEQLRSLRPDVAFMGANGVSAGFAFSTPDSAEAAVKTAMIRAARKTVMLLDSSKFGMEALVRFADFDDVDVLITDAQPPVALLDSLRAADVDVVIA